MGTDPIPSLHNFDTRNASSEGVLMTANFSSQMMLLPRLQLCQKISRAEEKGNKAKQTCAGKLVWRMPFDFFMVEILFWG